MDKIEICNIALGRIGVDEIERMDEASQAARVCTRYYDFTRKNVLRKFPWTFSIRRVTLAMLDSKQKDFKYAYRYPSDALYARKLFNEDCLELDENYRIISDDEGRVLLSNTKHAKLEYTVDVKDVSLMDDEFIEAFSWKLASEIAFSLTGNMGIAQNAVQAYNAYFNQAAGDDAAEERILDPQFDKLVLARF